ncbi:glycosyltransferase family 4 protein [Porticoccaceae bacterium nBUS_09]
MSKFISIHSGAQHSYQVAVALKKCNLLHKHYTSIYKDCGAMAINLSRLSPKFRKAIANRYSQYLSASYVETMPYFELTEIFLRRIIGNNKFTVSSLPRLRDELFSKWAASFLQSDISGVVGFPNCSLEVFKKVKNNHSNACLAIEQPIGHYSYAQEIFEEEMQLHPSFADSITFATHSPRFQARVDEELSISTHIFAGSKFVKSTLVNAGYEPQKIYVNNYGSIFPVETTHKASSSGPLRILFVGQVSQRKGIKYLFDAVNQLRRSGTDVHLTVVGKLYGAAGWMPDYEPLIDELIPHVSRDRLAEIFRASDVFVLPSLFEGSALVVYEALAFGLPCIVTPNTGSDCIIDEINGNIVPIRRADSIAHALQKFVDDKDLLLQMSVNALKSAADLRWESYHRRMKEILFEAIS